MKIKKTPVNSWHITAADLRTPRATHGATTMIALLSLLACGSPDLYADDTGLEDEAPEDTGLYDTGAPTSPPSLSPGPGIEAPTREEPLLDVPTGSGGYGVDLPGCPELIYSGSLGPVAYVAGAHLLGEAAGCGEALSATCTTPNVYLWISDATDQPCSDPLDLPDTIGHAWLCVEIQTGAPAGLGACTLETTGGDLVIPVEVLSI